MKEKARREKENNEDNEKVAREQLKQKPKKERKIKVSTPILVAIIGLIGTLCVALLSFQSLVNWFNNQLNFTPSPNSQLPITTSTLFSETNMPISTPFEDSEIDSTIANEDSMTLLYIPAGEFIMGVMMEMTTKSQNTKFIWMFIG